MLRFGNRPALDTTPKADGLAPLSALSAPSRAASVHPAWKKDSVVDGTYPESAQVGTVRQLFRVIGHVLAENTVSQAESIKAAADAFGAIGKVGQPASGLYAAVDIMEKATEGYSQATRLLTQHFKSVFAGTAPKDKLARLMALGTTAFEMMMDTQLSKPEHGHVRENGDRTMRTAFGVAGDVTSVELRLLRGNLSACLIKNLEVAQRSYDQQKEVAKAGGVVRDDSVFDVTINVGRGSPFVFKSTQADLKKAYLQALVQYASIGYADRVREDPSA